MSEGGKRLEIAEDMASRLWLEATGQAGRRVRYTIEAFPADDGDELTLATATVDVPPDNSSQPIRIYAKDRDGNTIGAGEACCAMHGLQKAALAIALRLGFDDNQKAEKAAEAAIQKAQQGGARLFALIGTFVVHAALIAAAAFGGIPDAWSHPGHDERPAHVHQTDDGAQCETDSECAKLCPVGDAECDGGPQS